MNRANMDFGLHLSSETLPARSIPEHINEMLTHARVADQVGFNMVGMGQHYLLDNPKPQTVPMLGRLAAETESAGLFTSILLLPLHHPVAIAEQFTTLANLTTTLSLGVGAGYIDKEFHNFGIRKESRGDRLEESIAIINRLWTGQNVTYEGDYYSVENATINPQPESKPPIWCGGSAPVAVERAARLADGWIPSLRLTREEISELKAKHYTDIRNESGESSAIQLFREAFVAPTTEQAYDIASESLINKYSFYADRNTASSSKDPSFPSSDFRSYADDRFLIGSPEEVCEKLEAFDEALDVSHVLLRVRRPGLSSSAVVDSLELIGDEVLPNV